MNDWINTINGVRCLYLGLATVFVGVPALVSYVVIKLGRKFDVVNKIQKYLK